jgi:hypothetical protein
MKKWTIILLGILILTCCERTKKDSLTKDNKETLIRPSKKLDNKEVPEKLLTLNTRPKTETTQGLIDEVLFGKFFCDRAEFYIIKNPQNEIYSKRPESITLYYLDGELRQTKYILNGDIITNLLHDLGGFKITGLDLKNREIVSAKQIITKTKNGFALNSKLDNYELKWTFGDKEIKYRVNADSKDKFVYLEKVKNYEKEFKTIEKYCI